jgi:tungstate transport system substrate-binding protein
MKKLPLLLSLLMIFTFLLSACAPAAAPTPAATEPPAAATEAPAAPTEPPAAPTEPPAEPTAAPTAAPDYPKPGTAGHLVLATTTSTQDSGLLDYLLPDFEKEDGVKVDVIAVGTGQALQLGKDGNADVLLVHSRAAEDEFMANNDGTRREDVMYNDFIIIGPENDPAGIKGMTDATEAFKKIAESQTPFISRGDKSGTHNKELSIWKKAEIEPAGDWYVSSGQGMGEVLTMANEQQAYTLSDRATYLARSKEGLDLPILVEGDKALFNPYGVIAVNPEKNANINAAEAQNFIDWIISVPVQEKIKAYGMEDFGQSLFVPDSQPWRDAQAGAAQPAPAGEAALMITGKVASEQAWTEEEIKAMPTLDVESTNKAGEKSTYTGVLISDLLKIAEPAADAATVVYVADDGFTAEVPLADVMACTDCIVSFRDKGGFSIVMPGFPGNVQVKGVVEIQVK